MTEKGEIYKCEVCGNVISVIDNGKGVLVCCGQDMKLFEVKTSEEGKEKHIPVVDIDGEKVHIKVGSVEHPMEENHYIEMIEITRNNEVIGCVRLDFTDKPEVEFSMENPEGIGARAFCNVHGLWSN